MASVAEGLEIGLKSVWGGSWPRAGPTVHCADAFSCQRSRGQAPLQKMLLKSFLKK